MRADWGFPLRLLFHKLGTHHEQEHREPTHQGEGPKRAHQAEHRQGPPLLPCKSLVSRLSHTGLGRVEPSRLPACASGQDRPKGLSERSNE